MSETRNIMSSLKRGKVTGRLKTATQEQAAIVASQEALVRDLFCFE